MTDGREDSGLVADEIGTVRREQARRRDMLAAGLVAAEGEPRPEEGVLMALPAEPVRPPAPSEALVANGGTLVPSDGGGEAPPTPAFGSLSLKFLVLAVVAIALALLWREMRRSRKDGSNG